MSPGPTGRFPVGSGWASAQRATNMEPVNVRILAFIVESGIGVETFRRALPRRRTVSMIPEFPPSGLSQPMPVAKCTLQGLETLAKMNRVFAGLLAPISAIPTPATILEDCVVVINLARPAMASNVDLIRLMATATCPVLVSASADRISRD